MGIGILGSNHPYSRAPMWWGYCILIFLILGRGILNVHPHSCCSKVERMKMNAVDYISTFFLPTSLFLVDLYVDIFHPETVAGSVNDG